MGATAVKQQTRRPSVTTNGELLPPKIANQALYKVHKPTPPHPYMALSYQVHQSDDRRFLSDRPGPFL